MSIGALAKVSVSWLNNHSALPMTGVTAACAMVSFSILLVGGLIIRYRAAGRT